jgi:acetyl-CoA acyltransferase
MKNAFIVDGVRTPIGSFGGSLSTIRADDLAAHAIAELMRRHPDIPPDEIADVVLGCANQAGEDNRRSPMLSSAAPTRQERTTGMSLEWRRCLQDCRPLFQVRRSIAFAHRE